MARRGGVRRRATLLVVAGLMVGGSWTVAEAQHGDDRTVAVRPQPIPSPPTASEIGTPPCDAIGGEELARTSRWRVVHTGDGGPYGEDDSPTPVVACERGTSGPARVRLLGMAKVEIEGGIEGGPFVASAGAGGDVVLLANTFYEQLGNTGGFLETGYTTLFDLARGASMRLPGAWLQRTSYFHDSVVDHELVTFVGRSGSLATTYRTRDGRHARTHFGPLTVWDASGRRELPGENVAFAGRDGRRGRATVVYSRTAGGENRRVSLKGAADLSSLSPSPALAWRSLGLKTRTEDEQGAYEDRPGNRYPGVGPRAHATVLDGDDSHAVVIGRFAPDRSRSSVRLVGRFATDRQRAFFALPAEPAQRRRAAAVVGDNVYAYSDGTTLRLWNHVSGGHVFAAPGLHDLAISGQAVFGTDEAGRVRVFGPYVTEPPPANDQPNPPEGANGPPPPNG
ncbi:MAG: hypothetical protein Q7T55_24015 [Solirubrobacteraceae bacterium]|nr:hypothetical protein [Solirubrobacteraceae bacterium]